MSEPDNDSALLRHMERELIEEADEVLTSVRVDREQMHETWNRALAIAAHTSPVQQFGVGFGIGWISGYLFRRVSKTAAFLVGCSFLALQGASALGIININWSRLGRVAQSRIRRVASASGVEGAQNLTDQITNFCKRHVYITSGFAAGAVMAITF